MNTKKLIAKFEELPLDKQQEVIDFVEFLINTQEKKSLTKSIPKQLDEISKFCGIWQDRKDINDSVEWVNEIRQTQWNQSL